MEAAVKALLVIVVVVLAGLVLYNYATTGRFTVVPPALQSQETRDLNRIEDRLLVLQSRLDAAGRDAALSGMDFSAEANAVRSDVTTLEMDLRDLRSRLSDDGKRRADALQERIEALKRRLS